MREKISKSEKKRREKEDKEFEADYTRKQKIKELQKNISELRKIIDILTNKAIEVKLQGLTEPYKQIISQIALGETRFKQMQAFAAQTEIMEKSKDIAAISGNFLNSVKAIMSSFDNTVFDKKEMEKGRRILEKTGKKIGEQSDKINEYLDVMNVGDGDIDVKRVSEDDIEMRIVKRMELKKETVSEKTAVVDNSDDEIKKLQKFLDKIDN